MNDLVAWNKLDITEDVHKIAMPTQVLCGSQDSLAPVKYSHYLTQKIEGAREDIIPGGDHFVQLDKYHQVNEQIERFLASLI